MRATKKTLLGLTGALAACIAAVLLLTFTGNGREAEDHAHTYYFTTYDSPEDLVLASVENSTGSVVLAASDGTYYTVGDLKLSADGAQVQSFFETVYKLPMKRLLDEADASDPQYGLTNPQAEILIQDTAEGGVLFRVGSATPDGEGYYACLSGDTRVFIMDQAYGAIFLNNVNRFYDLSLYPSLIGDDLGGLRGFLWSGEGSKSMP